MVDVALWLVDAGTDPGRSIAAVVGSKFRNCAVGRLTREDLDAERALGPWPLASVERKDDH